MFGMKIYQILLALCIVNFICFKSILSASILIDKSKLNLFTTEASGATNQKLLQPTNAVYFSRSVNDFMNG